MRDWLSSELESVKSALQSEVRDLRALLGEAAAASANTHTATATTASSSAVVVRGSRAVVAANGRKDERAKTTRAAGAEAVAGAAARLDNLKRVSRGLLATFHGMGLTPPAVDGGDDRGPTSRLENAETVEADDDMIVDVDVDVDASRPAAKAPFSLRFGKKSDEKGESRVGGRNRPRTPLGGHNLRVA